MDYMLNQLDINTEGSKQLIRHFVISNIFRGQGAWTAAPEKFLNGLHAKPIGYKYGRFKAVD